ncbi:MAG: DUF3750 domain-containing protein [Hyphomicrobiales bacterium]
MRSLVRGVVWFVVVLVVLPVAAGAVMAYGRGWPESWRTANWSSSGLLLEASAAPTARVLILAARTGNWKSIFAEHLSIVLKPEGAAAWTRYDVVGWGSPVRRNAFAAYAFWYGNRPYVVFELEGAEAARLIPEIEETIGRYLYTARGSYAVWPGPNSNSFVAWVVRNTGGFETELPPAAVGKDYLGPGFSVADAPSGTGYTVSFAGIAGLTAAWREGLEINLGGAIVGIDADDLAVKLPSLGTLILRDLAF